MTTVLDLIADASPTSDDVIYVVNDPGGTPGNRQVTLGNLATALAGMSGTAYVTTTGAQAVAGVKTFSDTPVIPDEAYGVAWNGKLEPATKNAVYDWSVSLPTLTTTTPLALSIYTIGAQTFIDALGGGAGSAFSDAAFAIQDNVDATKQVMFQVAGLTTATIRTLTVPDASGTLVLQTATQSLSSKTLLRTTLLGAVETITVGPLIYGTLCDLSQMTLDFASALRLPSFDDRGVTIFNQAGATGLTSESSFGAYRTIRNTSGSALNLALIRPFLDADAVIADTAAVTVPTYTSFSSRPVFSVTGGGTMALTNLQGINPQPSVGPGVTVTTWNNHASLPINTGGTVTTLNHYKVNNVTPSGGGTIAAMYGLSIDALLGATLNMGIRNAAGTQYEPTARTIAAVGDSLVSTTTVLASRYELTNSSGGSLTLTSAPTLPDGVAGQTVTFLNVGAQNIVIQDQGTLANSNLRLSAGTITLGPRDSIRLAWSTGIGDWVQEGQTNVL